ncbi:MAG: TonB-dependent receptor domain-containing protein [Parvibaculales bacterium]
MSSTLALSAHSQSVDEVIVLSTPTQKPANEVISTTEILSGDALQAALDKPIGDALSSLPGVDSAGYGPAVGQPLIRGLGGYRVDTMVNGMSIGDIAATGGDHANALSLFDTNRVEVLKGPAALRYGAFAATGVVNSFNRHMENGDDATDVLLGFGDNAGETMTAFFARREGYALSGFAQDADPYTAPTHAESTRQLDTECEHEQEDDPSHVCEAHPADSDTEIDNTQNESRGFTASGHFGNDATNLSLMLISHEMDYGVPGHSHGDDEETVIDLEKQTVHARLNHQLGDNGLFRNLQSDLTFAMLEQNEVEGTEVTAFEKDSLNLRAEVSGAAGMWQTFIGLEYRENESTTTTDDDHGHGYLPNTERAQFSLFAFAERDRNDWLTELALRLDSVEQDSFHDDADENASVSHDLTNISAGLARKMDNGLLLGGSVSSTERAPSQVELFAEGVHHGASRYEAGDATLDKETSLSTELYLRRNWNGQSLRFALFQNDYSDFIYAAHGECADIREDASDCTNVDEHTGHIEYKQQDAELSGYELQYQTGFNLSARMVDVTFSYSSIEGELANGDNLPAIPPQKIGVSLASNIGPAMVTLDIENAADQNDVALNDADEEHDDELATDGYTSVDLSASWQTEAYEGLTITGAIRNLTDEEIRHHTSPVKDLLPEAGQDIRITARYKF